MATGITTWVIAQAMINIGAVSGAIPFTGVPLPFVSYGGSSLVITLTAMGLLLNISKYANSNAPPPRNEVAPTQPQRKGRVLQLEPNKGRG
jgi:cell division protein FtsW